MTSPGPKIFINEDQVAEDIAAAVAAEATEREAADAALQDAIDAGGSGVAIDDTTPSTSTVFSSTKVNEIVAAAIAGPDDVLSFANVAAFPATGALDTLYVALDTNFLYRWSGSAYVQVGGGTGGSSSDLIDRPVSHISETAVIGQIVNNDTAGSVITAPALPGAVGTPPAKWGAKNLSALGTQPVSYTNYLGTTTVSTLLPGAQETFHHFGAGWKVESDSKSLTQLDSRYFKIISPSGDTTGVTDRTVINAALAAGGNVTIAGDAAGTLFWLDAALVMPSNTTLTLINAHVKLINGATANLVKNSDQSGGGAGNTNIAIRGIGMAWLDGNAVNQVRNTGAGLPNVGLYFVHVAGLTIDNIRVGPTAWFAGCLQGCTDVRYTNIDVNQDQSLSNQDGLDIGPGCARVYYENITGATSDDGFSIYAKSSGTNVSAWAIAQTAAGRNISDITIMNADLNFGGNPIRVQAGDGSTLTRVRAYNINNRRVASRTFNSDFSAIIQFGPINYVTTVPAAADLSDILIDGYTGCFIDALAAESNFSNVTMRNITMIRDDATGTATWQSLIGVHGHSAGFAPTFSNVLIENVQLNRAVSGTLGVLVNLPSGTVGSNLTVRNVHAAALYGINSSACAISGLHISDINIGQALGTLFTQTAASTGTLGDVTVDSAVAGALTFSGATPAGLRIVGAIPVLGSTDTTPAPVLGSQIICNASKDPSGNSYTTPGYYMGSGISWYRVVNLPGDVSAPTTPGTPTATGGLGIALTWTASTDNVSVYRYRVYRSDAPTTVLGYSSTNSYTDNTAVVSTAYTYTVDAQDIALNSSAKSASSNSASATSSPTIVNDTFTGTDGTTLASHTGEVGATWTRISVSGGAVLDTGRLRNGATITSYYQASGTPSSANYTIDADFVFQSILASSSMGIYGRVSGSASTWSGYGVRYLASAGAWQLIYAHSNTFDVLASLTTSPGASETHHVKLVMSGTSITGYIDGSIPTGFAVTDSNITAAGLIGLIASSSGSAPTSTTGIHLDNLVASL